VQLSLKDESVQGKCIYENDKLQDFLQLMSVQLKRKKNKFEEHSIITTGLKSQFNLFKVQYLPLETLEKNYNKSTKYILRDLLETI